MCDNVIIISLCSGPYCLYVVTSSLQIQNLFRFLLQRHASLCKFMQVHAIIMLAYCCYFFYSPLSREFSANPRYSSTYLPSFGPVYSFMTFHPSPSCCQEVASASEKRSKQVECCRMHLLTKARTWPKCCERRMPWTKRRKRSRRTSWISGELSGQGIKEITVISQHNYCTNLHKFA